MRILFLHPNFPGQFLRPALLMAQQGHEVHFLCHTHYDRRLPGVKRITLKGKLSHEALQQQRLHGHAHTMALAEQFRSGMEQLRASGWDPDLVVSHSGWGCGLHSAVIWPRARRLAYVEWWFAADAELYSYCPSHQWWPGPTDGFALRERNLALALELNEADALVSPTQWQRQQLPAALRQRCHVVPDGVDLNRFKPAPERLHPKPLLTYGTRGMEPMRGFTEFVEELPPLLKAIPELEVEIAGEDQICYGGKPPAEGSYGRWAQRLLEPWITNGRVRLLGRLEPGAYVSWLQRSWVHTYLTRPFVASWSLAEAMACGCCLLASDVTAVHEFTGRGDQAAAWLVDQRQTGWLHPGLEELVSSPEARNTLKTRARRQSKKWTEKLAFSEWISLVQSL